MTDENLLGGLSINRNHAVPSRWGRYLVPLLILLLLGGGTLAWRLTTSDPVLGPGNILQSSSGDTSTSSDGNAAQQSTSNNSPSLPDAAQAQPVPALSSSPQSDKPILDASGYVVAMRIATASSKTVGRVEEVLVEEGMAVTEGQIIARLDSVSQRIQLDLARAKLQRAEAVALESTSRLREAQLALDRTRTLSDADLLSAEAMDNASIRVDILNAELQRQEADIRIVEQEIRLQEQLIEDSIIRAPFDGVVIQKNAQPGEIVSPSSSGGFTRTGICTIVDMSSLEIEVNVSESYINRIFVGQRARATLDAYPDWTLPAAVSAIVPTADRQRATIKVRVRFLELGDPRILPDMGIKVSFFDSINEG